MNPPCDVLLPGHQFQTLHQHLFPGDQDEHGAVMAVSTLETARGIRLLGQRVFCAQDGVDYVPGTRGYRQLRAEFIANCLEYCRDNGLGYLAVHNHGGNERVAFSSTDLASHVRGYPTLLDLLNGQPAGALVFAQSAAAGDVWFPDGRRIATRSVRVIDTPIRLLTATPTSSTASDQRFHRQVLMFGSEGQSRLRSCRVAVIGLGGVGSLLVEYLARLGVGELLLIDPDRLDVSNLPRVVGANRWDMRWPLCAPAAPTWARRLAARLSVRKTDIARRLARQANPACKTAVFQANIADDAVANACRDCDFLFLAADSMQARLTVNALVQQYLIPGLQVGSKVVTRDEGSELVDAYSVIRWMLPGAGCLWCNGLISPERLAWEAKTLKEQRDQRYGLDIPNPSVITLNAVGASHAASRFKTNLLELADTESALDLRVHHLSSAIYHDQPRRDPSCPECGIGGRLARGPTARLPTLVT